MTPQETMWLLQSIWEAFKVLSPVVALALITWITWGVTK